MEKTNIEVRGIEAAEVFLRRRGYDIIGWELDERTDLIADDGETVAFVSVKTKEGGWPDEEPVSVEAFEDSMMRFFEGRSDLIGRRVRCDAIRIAAAAGGRAMIKHHLNCLGDGPLTNLEWLAKHDPGTLLEMIDPEHHGWLGQLHEDDVECGGDGNE